MPRKAATATNESKPKTSRAKKPKAPNMPAKKYDHRPETCPHEKEVYTGKIESTWYETGLHGDNRRLYERCSLCGDIRYMAGYEMPAQPAEKVYQSPKYEVEAPYLFDLRQVEVKQKTKRSKKADLKNQLA